MRVVLFYLLLIGVSPMLVVPISLFADTRLELPRDTNGVEVLMVIGGGYDETANLGEETLSEPSAGFAILTEKFYIDVHEISYRFRPAEDLLFKVFGATDSLPNEEDIPQALAIKSGNSFDAGLLIEQDVGDFRLGISMAGDITGTYSGYKIELAGGLDKYSNNAHMGANIGARYRDRKRSNYYFGVSESEAGAELMVYNAQSEWSVFAEAFYIRKLTHNLGMVLSASITSLSESAQNSPRTIPDSDIDEIEAFAGLIWQFSVI